MANKASWIPAPTAPCAVGDAETPTPGPGELLVKIRSIAFSPIEAKIQKYVISPGHSPLVLK
jgi:NADPH:quinone reductase-like Zn-dependent oxidoreductase